jgi:hypothetical protein
MELVDAFAFEELLDPPKAIEDFKNRGEITPDPRRDDVVAKEEEGD